MEWGDTAGWLAEEDNAIEPSLSGGGGGGGRVQGTRIALGQAASGAVCLGAGKDRVPEAYVVVVHGRRRGRRLRVRAMLKLNNGRTAVSPLRGSGAVGAEAYLEGIDSSRWAAAVAAAAAAAASTGTVSRLSLKHLLRCFDFYSIDRKFCNGTNLNTLYQYHWSMRLSTGSWHSWYPVKHMEIKVVSIENSEVLADGSKGVVKVRGPQVMKGYYKDHFFQFTDVKMMGCSFQISPILIVDESFTVDNGLLTSTLKIRRDKFRSANETVDHLFVSCPLARFACNVIASAFGLEKINSIQHLLEAWLNEFDKKKKQLVAVGIAATLGRWKAKEVYNVGSTLRLAKAGCKRDYIIPSIAGTLIEDGWRCETNQQRKETGNRLEELKQRKRQINEGPHVIDK
uniref:AMP-dependent synthetase/ligase domain-containing protein n=1 Tax=Oryza glumipatula TaxID=40148 RepID=A0A0E0B569_9ORYZ